MKTLTQNEVMAVGGAGLNLSGFGGKNSWGSYGRVSVGYTFNPKPNVSVTPSITVTKSPISKPKITGGGVNIGFAF